ncbi:MAG TPA: MBL fold metallo-hydrolase [Verrucomicrobiae bacterium]|jgi:glyoxylase-like metal-dependent hydrolase (beta-lactamase superfamily II)
MGQIPLEDNYADVAAKAQRGLGLSDAEVARQAGVGADEWARFKSGQFDEGVARKIAGPLQLGAEALGELARQAWTPEPVRVEGLAAFNTPYHDMTVNSYLVFDAKTGQAAAFDTGASAGGMLEAARERKLAVACIFLTHAHPDHIADLARLEKETGASAFIGEKEELSGPKTFAAGHVFRVGGLKIETRHTSGHARGGITYVVTGLERRLAIVGDALFAASMGGGAISYEEALRTNRREIFSLPDDTVICPGHGPMTTVGGEKKHNPFYPEFQK